MRIFGGLYFLLVATAWAAGGVADLRKSLEHPPDDARILMRWWWFGPAVTTTELEREMRKMKEGGIGGFEIQPVYPLELDGNLPYLSAEFLEALRFTAAKARELGLRVDLTLGSGWPFGGPHIPVTQAAARLRTDRVPVPAGARSIALPDLAAGEKPIAAFLARGDQRQFSAEGLRQLQDIDRGRLRLPPGLSGPHVVLFFVASRTGQQVKRPAVDSEGFVLDHYDRAALDTHLKRVGEPMLAAFGSNPPHAVFSDSLEVYGNDWTGDLPGEFRKRRGYDLVPLLPALIGDIGPQTADVRHDWGRTLTELAEERYLTPLREWARRHGVRLRLQTYGTPPVVLSSNALVDLPEGEGPHWRGFSTARWAASASHLYGRPVTSSETWTWLHSPSFRATPLDMKAEADLHFLQGVNQLIGHGWPYSPPEVASPGWRFYAAAVFNDHNPWWPVMPDISRYLQRVSYLLRQGKPANDVALYLPTSDAWAQFTAGRTSVNALMEGLIGADVIPRILDTGFNFDFIDDRAIEQSGIVYPVIVMPKCERIPEGTTRKFDEFRRRGGVVLESARLAELARLYPPDFATGDPAVGFLHRKLDDGELYFIANTANRPVHTKGQVRLKGMPAEWWDPFTARTTAAVVESGTVSLDLEPYESRILVFSAVLPAGPSRASRRVSSTIDLSSDWTVTFAGLDHQVRMPRLRSWSEDEPTRFFSGQATYEKTVALPAASSPVFLNFGEGTPVPETRRTNGMRAWLDSPIREAALVYVNGVLAGPVWRPPYEVDVTRLLRAGDSQIRVVVSNLAINELAGRPVPDYRLLNLRYGARFQAQDMEDLKPLPAGLLGPVRLIVR